MPIYEYQCRLCGHGFEMLRRMKDADTDVECPKCRLTLSGNFLPLQPAGAADPARGVLPERARGDRSGRSNDARPPTAFAPAAYLF
jgi:putative FmdB family regulatory protein